MRVRACVGARVIHSWEPEHLSRAASVYLPGAPACCRYGAGGGLKLIFCWQWCRNKGAEVKRTSERFFRIYRSFRAPDLRWAPRGSWKFQSSAESSWHFWSTQMSSSGSWGGLRCRSGKGPDNFSYSFHWVLKEVLRSFEEVLSCFQLSNYLSCLKVVKKVPWVWRCFWNFWRSFEEVLKEILIILWMLEQVWKVLMVPGVREELHKELQEVLSIQVSFKRS